MVCTVFFRVIIGKGIRKTILSCQAKPCFNIEGLVRIHGKHTALTDAGGTWYPQACRLLNLKHHVHFPLEKSLIERTMQCIKDRTEGFNGCFPYRIKNCKLKLVKNWLRFFADYHDNDLKKCLSEQSHESADCFISVVKRMVNC